MAESRPGGADRCPSDHNEGCTDPLIHKSASLSREGSFRTGSHAQTLWGGRPSGVGCSLIPRRAIGPLMGRPGVQRSANNIGSQKRFLCLLEAKGFDLIATKIMGA